ncbi:(Fe-S)-binding protein [Candidatus Harpocratesius sp.]
MSKEKSNVRKEVITSGPPVSGIFSPHRDNLLKTRSSLKNELGFEECVQCGYCRNVCRVYNVTFNEKDYAGGRNRILKSLSRNAIKFDKDEIVDTIYRCMLCGNCREVCPIGIDTVAVFQKFRKDSISKGVLPEKLDWINKAIKETKNPFRENHEDRFKWTEKSEPGLRALKRGIELFQKIEDGEDATMEKKYEVGYFLGCTSAYRNTELAIATSQILERLGMEFIFFPEEQCCGSVQYRTGLEDHTLDLIRNNVEMIRKSGVRDVVFSCSGCYSTFLLEYPRLFGEELGFNLYHIAEYAPKIIKEKGLNVRYTKRTKDNPMLITYHDPCHLGRYCKKYDEPRELINMIEGVKLIEMKHIREMSWCCGAGGGVKALYGELAGVVARNRLGETTQCMEILRSERLMEAEQTNAEVLVSSCVFCKNNLNQAATEDNSELLVTDISEILQDCEFY